MIFSCVGIRYQDGWQGEVGELTQTRRAGTRDTQVRCAIGLFHAMMNRRHESLYAGRTVCFAHSLLICLSREMDRLKRRLGEIRQSCDDRAVDSLRTLAAAHDKQRRAFCRQAKR